MNEDPSDLGEPPKVTTDAVRSIASPSSSRLRYRLLLPALLLSVVFAGFAIQSDCRRKNMSRQDHIAEKRENLSRIDKSQDPIQWAGAAFTLAMALEDAREYDE